jgi:hypothetical protein
VIRWLTSSPPTPKDDDGAKDWLGVLLLVQAVLAVFYFSPRAERVQMFGPRRRLINVACAGTARSADNLKGAGNRLASIHSKTQPWRVCQCNLGHRN